MTRWPSSSAAATPRAYDGGVYSVQWKAAFARHPCALLVFGTNNVLPIDRLDLHLHGAKIRADRLDPAGADDAAGGVDSHAKRGRLPKHYRGKCICVGGRGQDGEHDPGPVFLHLDRREEYIKGAG